MIAETRTDYIRVGDLFDAALARPPAERQGFLDEACGSDRALRQAVDRRLRALERADRVAFLRAAAPINAKAQLPPEAPRPAISPPSAADDPMIGQTVAGYRIEDRIAIGGMGAVYLATRGDERVAFKVIRPESDSDEALRRFRRERKFLAELAHPNIARLIDAGGDADRPYCIMEYVEGRPIDAYCDAHKLDVLTRLHLFVQVCAGVEHAHSRGMLHRDLKPANIMVTDKGVPKLLDFGIAKRQAGLDLGPTTDLTRGVLGPMTLDYASPEQVLGRELDQRSDVYSLGLLLYLLLTGRRPYLLGGLSLRNIERAICVTMPEKPSKVLITHVTPGEPARVIERPRDLDAIALRTLRKKPRERYPSVEALRQDLERYLHGLPVVAKGHERRRTLWAFLQALLLRE